MAEMQVNKREEWLELEKTLRSRVTKPPAPCHPSALARSGLDWMRGIMMGELPNPPICETLDFFMVVVDPGHVAFQGNPRPEFCNPMGTIHGGWMSALLDSCASCAVQSMLPVGKGFLTLDLKINFVRPVMPGTGPLRADGKVINMGNRVGVAEGRLEDATGKLYGHCTATCMVLDVPT